MSFAGPRDPALAQALQIAREKGILVIAAAGNNGPKSPPLYPGADRNVMAVTATDENDRLFNSANQGKYITVAAPGVDILVPAPDGAVQFTTGTSVATANVSGVAALLLAQKPSVTPEEIRAILVRTAKHLGSRGINPQFGAGLVDPLKALELLISDNMLRNRTASGASSLRPIQAANTSKTVSPRSAMPATDRTVTKTTRRSLPRHVTGSPGSTCAVPISAATHSAAILRVLRSTPSPGSRASSRRIFWSACSAATSISTIARRHLTACSRATAGPPAPIWAGG